MILVFRATDLLLIMTQLMTHFIAEKFHKYFSQHWLKRVSASSWPVWPVGGKGGRLGMWLAERGSSSSSPEDLSPELLRLRRHLWQLQTGNIVQAWPLSEQCDISPDLHDRPSWISLILVRTLPTDIFQINFQR